MLGPQSTESGAIRSCTSEGAHVRSGDTDEILTLGGAGLRHVAIERFARLHRIVGISHTCMHRLADRCLRKLTMARIPQPLVCFVMQEAGALQRPAQVLENASHIELPCEIGRASCRERE